jgi:AcrR family transcriptional regulator
MAQGFTNAGVARRLVLSERTVEADVRRLLGKLDGFRAFVHIHTDGRYVSRVASTIGRPARPHLRDDFIAAAQRLIAGKGFESMSIEDVIREVGVSKGAFYHYFSSKSALLEAVVARMADGAGANLATLLQAPGLTATQRLQRFFSSTMVWKTERLDLMLALLRVWHSDDNAIVREKLRRSSVRHITPLLARVLREGIETGEFATLGPDEAAAVTVSLVLAMADTLGEQILAYRQGDDVDAEQVLRTAHAYSAGLERVLGARQGTVTIVDDTLLQAWLTQSVE